MLRLFSLLLRVLRELLGRGLSERDVLLSFTENGSFSVLMLGLADCSNG